MTRASEPASMLFQDSTNNPTQDIADTAEALRALQRVCGFNHNHNDIFLAYLAAAPEHGNQEFRASFAELGARMSGEVEPYKKHMTTEERRKRRRALEQRFKRAYRKLEEDQKATGLWFVTVQSGGFSEGRRVPSLIQVDVDAITRTIEIARQSEDFTEYRMRCFERAAEKVCEAKPRRFSAPTDALAQSPREEKDSSAEIRRYDKTIKGYAGKLYKIAAEAGFSDADLEAMKELLKRNLDRWFAVDFPAALEADKERAEADSTRPDRMNALAREIEATTAGKVHASDPHTNSLRGTDSCTVGVATQGESFTHPVTLKLPQDEASKNDRVVDDSPLSSAMLALDVVASIGAWRFNVILVDDARGEKKVLDTEATLEDVRAKLPAWFAHSEREQKSLVLDMKPNGRRIIQVDEANAEVMDLLAPVSFMTVETSPSNGQVWLALPEGLNDAESGEIKERLFTVLKARGANKGASGGLRWVGTYNFKPERKAADGSFPRVKLLAYNMRKVTSAAELDKLNLLAESQPKPQFKSKADASCQSQSVKRVPSYEHAIASVRRKENGEIDRSAVDVHFAAVCLSWGLSEGDTVDLINLHSPKAQERRDDYAEKIVTWASRQAQGTQVS